MGCGFRRSQKTGFLTDQPFRIIHQLTSPHRWIEQILMDRPASDSKELSLEDVELAQHLVNHTQRIASSRPSTNDQDMDRSTPSQELLHSESTFTGQEASSLVTVEQEERESSQSYAPVVSQPGSVSSGQVCRYSLSTFFHDSLLLTFLVTAGQAEHLYGGGHHRERPFATLAVFT